MIVPLGYVTTFPAARNASTCERESGVRIIWRRSSPIVSTQAPQVGLLRILHGRNDPLGGRNGPGAVAEARRSAVPGVRLCIACQESDDRDTAHFSGYNRRGSKDFSPV